MNYTVFLTTEKLTAATGNGPEERRSGTIVIVVLVFFLFLFSLNFIQVQLQETSKLVLRIRIS